MRPIDRKLTLLLLLWAAATLCRGQTTRVDATRLLKPSGTNSRLLVTNGSGSTVWTDAENFLSGSTGISISGNTIGVTLGGSAGNIQFNNSSALGGSAGLNWNNAATTLQIGQPLSGTGRIIVKGAGTNNSAFAFQGFDNGDTERSRITDGGYFQGTGLGRVGFDYGSAFTLDARLYQPTSVTSTATSGATSLAAFAGSFAPTSGNAIMNLVEVTGTINQSGSASGKTRMLYLAANAVSAPELYGLETVGGVNLIGNGTVPAEVMPRLAVVGLGNTSGSNAFSVYNTSGQIGLSVRDDGNVGIGTAAPAYKLDISGNTGIRLPAGTIAQRPAGTPAGVIRYNSSDHVFEGADGTSWVSFGGSGSNPYTAEVSPAQITADQNDYNPSGLSSAAVLRVYTDGTFRKITGLSGGAAMRTISILNVGDYTLMLKHESAASTAADRFDFDSDDLFVFPGEGVQLYYDATDSRWRCLTRPGFGGNLDYVTFGWFRHGVAGSTATSTNQGDFYVKANSGGSGAGSGTFPFAASGISSSTSATANGSIGSASQYVRPSAYTYLSCTYDVFVDIPSDGTNTYTARVGWMNAATPSGEPSNGVYFRYTDGVNSGNWQFVARSASTESVLNTGTTISGSGSAPQALKVVIDPNGTQCEGFIDGVSVGVLTTNVPTGANLGHYAQLQKTAGTGPRILYLTGANFRVITNTRR